MRSFFLYHFNSYIRHIRNFVRHVQHIQTFISYVYITSNVFLDKYKNMSGIHMIKFFFFFSFYFYLFLVKLPLSYFVIPLLEHIFFGMSHISNKKKKQFFFQTEKATVYIFFISIRPKQVSHMLFLFTSEIAYNKCMAQNDRAILFSK